LEQFESFTCDISICAPVFIRRCSQSNWFWTLATSDARAAAFLSIVVVIGIVGLVFSLLRLRKPSITTIRIITKIPVTTKPGKPSPTTLKGRWNYQKRLKFVRSATRPFASIFLLLTVIYVLQLIINALLFRRSLISALSFNWGFSAWLLFFYFMLGVWDYCNAVIQSEHLTRHFFEFCPELNDTLLNARITMPFRINVGDSRNIAIESHAASGSKNTSDYLEVELQAAGMNINGDFKQHQQLNSSKLHYLWNCNFATAGNHSINVLLRLLSVSGDVKRDLTTREYTINAISLYRQYAPTIILAFVSVLSLLYLMKTDIITAIHSLGI